MVILLGFVAGFLATLTVHQLAIGLLNVAGAGPRPPYSMSPVPPLGVPAVLNLAFWGGMWGIVWALVVDRMPRRWPLWLAGLIFGALAPTLVGWFVVNPIKGLPVANGFNPARMWIGPLVNGVWGLGTALIYEFLRRRRWGR
ncbi:MAG TPA: hypothetical protein VF744_03400 [Beijerinckiaceae bacterium]